MAIFQTKTKENNSHVTKFISLSQGIGRVVFYLSPILYYVALLHSFLLPIVFIVPTLAWIPMLSFMPFFHSTRP